MRMAIYYLLAAVPLEMNSFKRIAQMLNPLVLLSNCFCSGIARLRRHQGATVVIEFAIILPLLLLMTLPVYDFFRYIMILQKMNKTASTIADMIVMSEPAPVGTTSTSPVVSSNRFILTVPRLTDIMRTADFLMQPYDFNRSDAEGSRQFINAVSVYNPPGSVGPGIYWSVTNFGTNVVVDPTCTSANANVGVCDRSDPVANNPTGDPSNYEGNFLNQMVDGENAIIVRICYDYSPIFNWNAVVLPIMGIAPYTVKSQEGQACDGNMASIARYYPVRNGPLLQIY